MKIKAIAYKCYENILGGIEFNKAIALACIFNGIVEPKEKILLESEVKKFMGENDAIPQH